MPFLFTCFLLAVTVCSLCFFVWRRKSKWSKIPHFKSKTVFISGCDSGFGHRASLEFAGVGVRTFAGCFTEAGFNSMKNVGFSNLIPVQLNIADAESVSKVATLIGRQCGQDGLWAVLNNAAVEPSNGPDDMMTIDGDYRPVFEVNVFGTVRLTQALLPLVKRARGRLIFVTSIKGRLVFPESGPYTLTKWAMEAYADLLRRELFAFGVSVHIVEPGGFSTNIAKHLGDKFEERYREMKADGSPVVEEYGDEYFRNRIDFFRTVPEKYQVTDLQPVVDAYVDAAIGERPKYRYVIGADAVYGYWPVSFLPECLQDLYFRRKFAKIGLALPAVNRSS